MSEFEEEPSLSLNDNIARITGLLIRHRWRIFLPFCCVVLLTNAALAFLPNRYTSSATLLVVEQQVPERYVVPNSTTDVTSALQAMKQEVLSRTQMLRMIDEFGLYPKEKRKLAPEQLVSLMYKNIEIAPVDDALPKNNNKDFDSFKISFTTENALLAQQVTTSITSLFISEYLRTGTEQATNTTSFLHRQVEEVGKQLEAQENHLRDFKLSHIGELPEQQQGNLGILTGLQAQLQNTMASLERAQQQRALLQAELQAAPAQRLDDATAAAGGAKAAAPLTADPLQTARDELRKLQLEKAELEGRGLRPQHPDVLANQRALAQAENRLKLLEANAPPPVKTEGAPVRATQIQPGDSPAAAQIKANLEANRVEIDGLTADEKRLKAQVAEYEMRLNQTPVREQEEAGILRNTEAMRAQYTEMQKKEQESQLATNLEKQQGGQQFRLVDAASLPTVPSSPKRLKISAGSAAAGLVLGLALAVFMQMRDTSYYSERELTQHIGQVFVLAIPLLRIPGEERRRKWWNVAQWAAASAILFAVGAAEFYIYKLG